MSTSSSDSGSGSSSHGSSSGGGSDSGSESAKRVPTKDDLSGEELLAVLDEETRFTRAELQRLVKKSSPRTSRKEFSALLADVGLGSALEDRLWAVFDEDADGDISRSELVVHLSRLTRGELPDLTREFFSLYDVDGDGTVSQDELVSVYRDILKGTTGTVMTPEQVQRAADFLEKADTNKDGVLSYDEFHAAVAAAAEEEKQANKPDRSCSFWLVTAYLVFITAFLEVGTSFSLPALGTISDRIKNRYDIDDAALGLASGVYFGAAMIGPLVGGYIMDRIGPSPVLLGANLLVLLGAALQAFATGPDQFWLLLVARFVIGLGGEVTPFCAIECLARLFPQWFLLMAGVRNLIQSSSGFAAFVSLPALADSAGELCSEELRENYTTFNQTGNLNECRATEETGTAAALWFCTALAGLACIATVLTHFYLMAKKAQLLAQPRTPGSILRSATVAVAPKPPTGIRSFFFHPAFYLAIIGIQIVYVPGFSFATFAVALYKTRFGMEQFNASMLAGMLHLLGGFLGPFFGPLSDWLGRRSTSLGISMLPAVVAFVMLAFSTSEAVAWIAGVLLGIQYGFGDTVAYVSIRLIVGEERAGVGYGVAGVLGNGLLLLIPYIGGVLFGGPDGETVMPIYFAVVMGVGALSWFIVRCMVGPKAALELAEKELIRTEASDLNTAALHGVLGEGDSASSSSSSSSSSSDDGDDAASPAKQKKKEKN